MAIIFLKKKRKKRIIRKSREKDLLNACIEYLQAKGYLVLRNNTGIIFVSKNGKTRAIRLGYKGSSDIIACSPEGRFVAIECKTKKGVITDSQKHFLEEVKKRGALALVVRSIDNLLFLL